MGIKSTVSTKMDQYTYMSTIFHSIGYTHKPTQRFKPLRRQIAELTAILALITITATFVSVFLHSMKPQLNSARSFESSTNDLSCSGLIPLHKATPAEKIDTWDLTPSSSLSTSRTTQRPTSSWQQAENKINIPTSTPNST